MKNSVLMSLGVVVGALSASAQSVTFSGPALSGLTYSGNPNPADAQYVPGTPDVAALYTADSGLSETADSPAVFVQGPMGPVRFFQASYDLHSSSLPTGDLVYWNLQVSPADKPSDVILIEIISMGGTPLNSSSAVHAYGPNYSTLPNNGYWGYTLAQLGEVEYDGRKIGDMTVDWAGVEIGDWGNGSGIASSAQVQSLTVPLPLTPQGITVYLTSALSSLIPTGNKQTDQDLTQAVNDLQMSLQPGLWTGGFTLGSQGQNVFNDDNNAIQELLQIKQPFATVAAANAAIFALVNADQTLAQTAITAVGGGNFRKLGPAENEIAQACEALAWGNYSAAINDYSNAWQDAEQAGN